MSVAGPSEHQSALRASGRNLEQMFARALLCSLEFEWNRGQLEATFERGSLSQADSEPFQVRD